MCRGTVRRRHVRVPPLLRFCRCWPRSDSVRVRSCPVCKTCQESDGTRVDIGSHPWCDDTQGVDTRVASLVAALTLEEKLALMTARESPQGGVPRLHLPARGGAVIGTGTGFRGDLRLLVTSC